MNHGVVIDMFSFAEQAHSGQKRSGGHSYICHPFAVMLLVRDITDDQVVLTAALGHDLLEDCAVTEGQLRSRFGDEITDLIVELTNDYPDVMDFEAKLVAVRAHASRMSERAKLVKLADRLHNLQTMGSFSPGRKSRFIKNTQVLMEALYPYPPGTGDLVREIRRIIGENNE